MSQEAQELSHHFATAKSAFEYSVKNTKKFDKAEAIIATDTFHAYHYSMCFNIEFPAGLEAISKSNYLLYCYNNHFGKPNTGIDMKKIKKVNIFMNNFIKFRDLEQKIPIVPERYRNTHALLFENYLKILDQYSAARKKSFLLPRDRGANERTIIDEKEYNFRVACEKTFDKMAIEITDSYNRMYNICKDTKGEHSEIDIYELLKKHDYQGITGSELSKGMDEFRNVTPEFVREYAQRLDKIMCDELSLKFSINAATEK